jgi:preprotein translocase subunit SecE
MLPSDFSHNIHLRMSKLVNNKVYLRIERYFKEVYKELLKVTWPTWKDLQSSAVLVMVASLIFAVVVFVMDFGFQNVIQGIYSVLLGASS